ncbi:NAD-dependent epimerase/dehydratase family protein [Trinickia mobilis]|uniref:NAD-dependent epimerase/dehydratase family protein n=1 Tax=Trinickia mobilis TaxID=2816356 RepID=UPI001F5D7BA9|nr:NAD(P)-dependent oxidoreductase [Trinickia mobilis]
MERVVVTGAAGLVGAHASAALSRHGFEVVDVLRLPSADSAAAGKSVAIDLSATSAIDQLRALLPLSALVHCAAALPKSFDGVESQHAAQINRSIDETVINFCATHAVRLIYCSGTAVYGPLQEDAPVREGHDLAPYGGYIEGKVWAEQEIVERVASHAILRICAPYGTDQRTRTVLRLFIERAIAGQTLGFFGTGTREQDFLHVDDLADLIVRAVSRRDVNGVFNASGGRPIMMRDLAMLVSRVVSNGRAEVCGTGRDDPQDGLRARFDLSLAEQQLGWRPVIALETGVDEWARQLREDGHAARDHL